MHLAEAPYTSGLQPGFRRNYFEHSRRPQWHPSHLGVYSVVLTVTDSIGLKGVLALSVTVTQLPLNIVDDSFGNSPPVAPGGTVGADYSALFLSGSGGSQNGYKWTVTGALPTGIVAGPPAGCNPPGCAIGFRVVHARPERFRSAVQLTDSANNTVAKNLSFVISVPVPAAQTVSFAPLPNIPVSTAPFSVSATASSGMSVTFASNTPAVCTVSGSTVTILMSGGCSITATQAGDSTYEPASATQRFTVWFADVAPGDNDYAAINAMAQLGITAGCGNNDFCPNENVTRDQMAIFIVRAIYGSDNFTYTTTPYFTDVTPSRSASSGFRS